MKYCIIIEETIDEEIEIEAKSEQEAMEIAARKYTKEEIVLSPGNVTFKQMAVKNNDKDIEWVPF